MFFLHSRHRQRVALHAANSLSVTDAATAEAHLRACAPCRNEYDRLRSVVVWLELDAAQANAAIEDARLPISSEAFETRVRAALREKAPRTPKATLGWATATVVALGSVVAVGFFAVSSQFRAPEGRAVKAIPPAPASDETAFVERLEREQTRASAARYLAEAQDVLVQMTAVPTDCPESSASVDVSRESEKSRLLLRRRVILTANHNDALAAAQTVLDDVEGVLRQVADLEHCTKRENVREIRDALDRKRLLMKIDLVTQELGE